MSSAVAAWSARSTSCSLGSTGVGVAGSGGRLLAADFAAGRTPVFAVDFAVDFAGDFAGAFAGAFASRFGAAMGFFGLEVRRVDELELWRGIYVLRVNGAD
jgi:hypothetical protein